MSLEQELCSPPRRQTFSYSGDSSLFHSFASTLWNCRNQQRDTKLYPTSSAAVSHVPLSRPYKLTGWTSFSNYSVELRDRNFQGHITKLYIHQHSASGGVGKCLVHISIYVHAHTHAGHYRHLFHFNTHLYFTQTNLTPPNTQLLSSRTSAWNTILILKSISHISVWKFRHLYFLILSLTVLNPLFFVFCATLINWYHWYLPPTHSPPPNNNLKQSTIRSRLFFTRTNDYFYELLKHSNFRG